MISNWKAGYSWEISEIEYGKSYNSYNGHLIDVSYRTTPYFNTYTEAFSEVFASASNGALNAPLLDSICRVIESAEKGISEGLENLKLFADSLDLGKTLIKRSEIALLLLNQSKQWLIEYKKNPYSKKLEQIHGRAVEILLKLKTIQEAYRNEEESFEIIYWE